MLKWFRRYINREVRSVLSGQDIARWFSVGSSFNQAKSGELVTPESAMQLTSVYACVRVLAETIASLPLHLYARNGSSKERARNHPLYKILHDEPNPLMSSFEFREMLMTHLALRGNAYAEIVRDSGGRVIGLWPWHPDSVKVKTDGWKVIYNFKTSDHREIEMRPEKVLHIKGLTDDGLKGLSPIRTVMDSIGLGLAADRYGSNFFKNDATPSILIKHPGNISPNAQKNLRDSWDSLHSGTDKMSRTAVLEEGMGIEKLGITPEEAQFLETRKFQVNEIARIFRIPPHMIGDLERSTFSNVEQQAIDFTVHTIRPWLRRIESAIHRALLTEEEREIYFAEFLMDELLRGDAKTRWETYNIALMNGIMSRNEIRDRENLNPLDDGDTFYVPANLIPVGQDQLQENNQEENNRYIPKTRLNGMTHES